MGNQGSVGSSAEHAARTETVVASSEAVEHSE
jgi:hypothetical protein